MSSRTGYGKISTSGLTFAYDLGDTDVSYKGKPTTNLVPDASNMTGWNTYDNGNDGTFITEFGTVGYKMYNRGSWNGVYRGISLPSTGTYTLSVYVRYLGGASDNNGGVIYTSGGGIGDTSEGHGKTVGEWVRFSMTRTYTTTSITFYLISYGGTYGGSYSSWEVTMPQVEAGSVATPFVDGTRSVTQSIIDLKGLTTVDVSLSSFNNGGQPILDGTDDRIDLGNLSDYFPSGVSGVTVEQVFKIPSGASGADGPLFENYRFNMWYNYSNDTISVVTRSGPPDTPGYQFAVGGSATISCESKNNYNHVVGIYETINATTGRVTMYVNGRYAGQYVDTKMGAYPIYGTWIGQSYHGGYGTYRLNGQVDVTKLYTRALSAEEIGRNFLHYADRFSIPVKDGSTAALAAPNAQHLYNLGIRARGTYWIKPTGYGGSAQEIYCDFDANGGWMMVASNNASVSTIPGGTARNNSNYYLNRSGAIGLPDPNGDFIIGSMIDSLEFSKVRIIGWGFASINGTYTYPSNLGTYVTAEWNLTTTGSSRYTEKVARGNVTIGGNGTVAPAASYFVLDAVQNDSGFNANSNQSTIGAAGLYASSGDPSDGCYLGHGISEGSWEGWYDTNSSVNDSQGYTTWVR